MVVVEAGRPEHLVWNNLIRPRARARESNLNHRNAWLGYYPLHLVVPGLHHHPSVLKGAKSEPIELQRSRLESGASH